MRSRFVEINLAAILCPEASELASFHMCLSLNISGLANTTATLLYPDHLTVTLFCDAFQN